MICDGEGCTVDNNTVTKVKLVTGKRGRPAFKHFCTECASKVDCVPAGSSVTVETRSRVQSTTEPRRTIPANAVPEGFDPAAVFLLAFLPDNLFEATDNTYNYFRCKGCKGIVTRLGRKDHYDEHKGIISVPADDFESAIEVEVTV